MAKVSHSGRITPEQNVERLQETVMENAGVSLALREELMREYDIPEERLDRYFIAEFRHITAKSALTFAKRRVVRREKSGVNLDERP